MNTVTGGQRVARTLRDLGAGILFSVSGNQILPIYDAESDSGLRLIHMRHESAAAYAAAASAEIQQRPDVVLVSAGPAFVCALAGIAAARSMELPLLFLSGATSVADAGRGGFQNFDQPMVAGARCKAALASMPDQPGFKAPLPADPALAPSEGAMLDAMAQRLAQARRPLLIARPCAARGLAGGALHRLAQSLGIEPIITECPRRFRRRLPRRGSHRLPRGAPADRCAR